MRDKLIALAIPSPSFLFAVGALIYLLRLMRRERERAAAAKVVTMPNAAIPVQEAA
jgi:hypothetical protein